MTQIELKGWSGHADYNANNNCAVTAKAVQHPH